MKSGFTGLVGVLAVFAIGISGCERAQEAPAPSAPVPGPVAVNAAPSGADQARAVAQPPMNKPFPGKGHPPFLNPTPEPPVPEPTAPLSTTPEFPLPGGDMDSPIRITHTDSGWLLATDSRRGVLLRVNPATLLADQALNVKAKPLAVGMLNTEIYVGIEDQAAVKVYSSAGDPLGYLATPGSVGHPGDLAVERTLGQVFVLDGLARDVKIYDAAARVLVSTLGQGQLLTPSGIALDEARQEVLISDYGEVGQPAAVRIFSYAIADFGALKATLSGAGICNYMGCRDGFSRPRGLAVHNGRIYIPDVMYRQVLVFDRATLTKLTQLGSGDPALSDLRMPSDVTITPQGDVFVTNPQTHSVAMFPGGAL